MIEREAAHALTEFLTHSSGYNSKPPIEEYVQIEIKAMAKKIAAEVVASNPQLGEVIRQRAGEVVNRALREDSYLNGVITSAIAKVLTERALGEEE